MDLNKLKLKIAWCSGYNSQTRHPIPCDQTIELSLAMCETVEEAEKQGIAYARLLEETEEIIRQKLTE